MVMPVTNWIRLHRNTSVRCSLLKKGVNRMKNMSFLLLPLALGACSSDDVELPNVVESLTVSTNFNDGEQGWEAGFSDFSQGNEEIFEFESEISAVPNTDNQNGFYLSAQNRSDDVFMFLKKQVTELEPNQRYLLEGTISFYTNAGTDCFGIGGSPGESVFLKTGAAEIEPAQADYYMNIDIGSQAQSGNDSVVIGTIGVPDIGCESEQPVGQKTMEFTGEDGFEFISSEDGDMWLYFGTDSGYEGRTQMIYTNVEFTLTPQ